MTDEEWDYLAGIAASRAGESFDFTETLAWQTGFGDAIMITPAVEEPVW